MNRLLHRFFSLAGEACRRDAYLRQLIVAVWRSSRLVAATFSSRCLTTRFQGLAESPWVIGHSAGSARPSPAQWLRQFVLAGPKSFQPLGVSQWTSCNDILTHALPHKQLEPPWKVATKCKHRNVDWCRSSDRRRNSTPSSGDRSGVHAIKQLPSAKYLQAGGIGGTSSLSP